MRDTNKNKKLRNELFLQEATKSMSFISNLISNLNNFQRMYDTNLDKIQQNGMHKILEWNFS